MKLFNMFKTALTSTLTVIGQLTLSQSLLLGSNSKNNEYTYDNDCWWWWHRSSDWIDTSKL